MKIALDPSTNAASGTLPLNLVKLRKSAKDFEAMLLSSLWKDMRLGFGEEEQGELGGMGGPLQDVAFQALAGQAVKSRGIGIADMIVHALERSATQDSQKSTFSPGQGFPPQPSNVQAQNILSGNLAVPGATPAITGASSLFILTGGANAGGSAGLETGATASPKD